MEIIISKCRRNIVFSKAYLLILNYVPGIVGCFTGMNLCNLLCHPKKMQLLSPLYRLENGGREERRSQLQSLKRQSQDVNPGVLSLKPMHYIIQ